MPGSVIHKRQKKDQNLEYLNTLGFFYATVYTRSIYLKSLFKIHFWKIQICSNKVKKILYSILSCSSVTAT